MLFLAISGFLQLYIFLLWDSIGCDLTIETENLNALCDVNHGDIDIGLIQSITKRAGYGSCSDEILATWGPQMVEMFRYAINEINDNNEILPNITLGYIIMDDCLTDVVSLARAVSFIAKDEKKSTNYIPISPSTDDTSKSLQQTTKNDTTENVCLTEEIPLFENAAGIIGPLTSRSSVMVASLLGLFEIPALATVATSDELSDTSR